MIKESLIDKVSKKFLFSKKDSELAIKEFLDFKSVLNSEQKIALLEICCSRSRFHHKLVRARNLFDGVFENDLLNKISEFLMNDPSIYVLSNFHLYNYVHIIHEFRYKEIDPN